MDLAMGISGLRVIPDGSNLVFRAYFGIRHLSASDGTPTNAVYGVTNMILRIIKDKQPTHIGFVLDAGGKNFRHELYPEYKANRPPPPEDLVVQFPIVRQAIEALAIPLVVVEGVDNK